MQLLTNRARAWVYSGDWVAHCPVACGNVEFLFDLQDPADLQSPRTVRKTAFYCSYCHHVAEIEWAEHEAAITEVLSLRPNPSNRNWHPLDHEIAIRARVPHGQSVQDLIDENHEHGVTQGGQ